MDDCFLLRADFYNLPVNDFIVRSLLSLFAAAGQKKRSEKEEGKDQVKFSFQR